MSIKRAIWRRRSITLTPLIDIIFLLLLFFMLSSTFTRYAEIPLVNAAGGAPQAAAPLFLQLRPGAVLLNGETVTLDRLPAVVEALRGDAETLTMLVTVTPEVSSQRLVDLLTVLSPINDLAVNVLD